MSQHFDEETKQRLSERVREAKAADTGGGISRQDLRKQMGLDKPARRDPARIPEILALIQTAWEEFPDMRLGQLLINVTGVHVLGETKGLFMLEDDQLMDDLQEWTDTSKNWTAR